MVSFQKIYKEVVVSGIMVEVKFRLAKKDFVYVGLIVVLLGVGFGYAYGGNDPAVMGHSSGEIEGICLSNGTNCDVTMDDINSCQICIQCYYDGMNRAGLVECVDVNSGWSSTSGDLTNNANPSTDGSACRIRMVC